jgi:branched-chain amino acid transport system permease protein
MANAVRDNPERAEFVGYSARSVRYVAFCAAGFFAGIAGGLFAANYEILTAENMGLNTSGSVLLMTFIGGIGYFLGPVAGAIVFTFLQSMLSDYTDVWLLYLGIVFLATVLFVPMGLTGILVMHGAAWRARRLGRLVGPYLLTALALAVAAIGVIGLVEMTHVLVSAPVSRSTRRLFWVLVNVRTITPWLLFAAVTAAGVLALRWTVPRAAAAFAHASGPGGAR